MAKEMGHVTMVSQWERGNFFAPKEGVSPPHTPFFDPFWRAHGQARLPNETESIREERVGVFDLLFSR